MFLLLFACARVHVVPPPAAVQELKPDSKPLEPFQTDDPKAESMNTEYYLGSKEEEQAQFEFFSQQMRELQERNAERYSQPIKRGVHAKSHGCYQGEFVLREDRDARTKHGVFAEEYSNWPVWVRFSNGVGYPQPDKILDVRGFAIKLMGVPGEKLMTTEEETQDFLLINNPSIAGRNSVEFMNFVMASTKGTANSLLYAMTKPRTILPALLNAKPVDSMIAEQYWTSGGAIHLGAHQATRMSVKSCQPYQNEPDRKDPDYLRKDLEQATEDQLCFTFYVQFQVDPKNTPIEDAAKVWETDISPEIPVGDIHLYKKVVLTPEDEQFCEKLAFNPWQGIPAHQPMGNMNRSRKAVYEASQIHRGGGGEPKIIRSEDPPKAEDPAEMESPEPKTEEY